MNKLKEDAKKNAEREAQKSREIAGLRKSQRQRDNQIRTLEAEKKLKEVVLRRKHEEVGCCFQLLCYLQLLETLFC